MKKTHAPILLLTLALSLLHGVSMEACSRVLWDTDHGNVVARTMDLYIDDHARLVVYPRGISRNSKLDNTGFNWKSTYGSVTVNSLGSVTSDGMNEKGLSANLLYLDGSVYEKESPLPALDNGMLVQYVLDSCSTVDEALRAISKVRIVSVHIHQKDWPLHLSIADKTGDSAVIEFIEGKRVVHHGAMTHVMTNEPPLDIQLANLKNYRAFGGTLPLPGDIDPKSRFVRASTFLKTLPKPKTNTEALAGVMSVARTTFVPFGAQDTSGGEASDTWATLWSTIADPSTDCYYFQSTSQPNLLWIDLHELNLKEGSPVLSINPNNPHLSGDISAVMKPLKTRKASITSASSS
jgi:choloylglycine hydrolase